MTFDLERHLGAARRQAVSGERDGVAVRSTVLSRDYDTTVEDLWDAVTNPARLARWFGAVTGDFALNGRYAVPGNASGTITACAPPHHLALTWEFGGGVSWVEVRLQPAGAGARLTVEHIAPLGDHMAKFGPGAAGVGWEFSAMELDRYLADPEGERLDENSFVKTPAGRAFIAGCSTGWAQAAIADGDAPADALAAAEATRAFYTGE